MKYSLRRPRRGDFVLSSSDFPPNPDLFFSSLPVQIASGFAISESDAQDSSRDECSVAGAHRTKNRLRFVHTYSFLDPSALSVSTKVLNYLLALSCGLLILVAMFSL